MSEITIEGRKFTVESDGDQYILTGVRGARYRALRTLPEPSRLYLINDKDWLADAPSHIWLTDTRGKLEVKWW